MKEKEKTARTWAPRLGLEVPDAPLPDISDPWLLLCQQSIWFPIGFASNLDRSEFDSDHSDLNMPES